MIEFRDKLKKLKENNMPREIPDSVITGDFPPMVGLREKGGFVYGKVVEMGSTNGKNPVVSLELINLEKATTSIQTEKGKYEEVEVVVGDIVQVIGSDKQLREKLPQLAVGDVVTITFKGKMSLKGSRELNTYSVIIDD